MDTRVCAADRLLDRGVRFILPAPFYIRWLRLNRITIKGLRAGTIMEFSRVVVKHNLEGAMLEGNYTFLEQAIEPVCQCVAIAMLNDEMAIACRAKRLAKRLMWRYSADVLVQLFSLIAELSKTKDFTIITRFLCNQTAMLMSPNLGRQKKGS